jgi:indolepyruvate decarboxylase
LKDHGAREIFGIPGDFVLPFFKVIEDSGILPHYTLSHEPGVGFAADAAARYHAGLGVAVVTYGAGAFNLVNAIAGAYAERSPVVVIAGRSGRGRAQQRLRGASPGPLDRHPDGGLPRDHLRSGRADRCGYRAGGIARVLRSARERSLPVYIELPRDMTAAPTAAVPVLPLRSADPDALAECAEEIIEKLADARAPVILVDVEIRRYNLEQRVTAWRASSGFRWSRPSWDAGCSRTRPTSCSAHISAPPATPSSPGWWRRPTRCCCSA